MQLRTVIVLALCGLLSACGGGGSGPQIVVDNLQLEVQQQALRGSTIKVTPRLLTHAGSQAGMQITLTVEQGSLLDSEGTAQGTLSVASGGAALWQLPDTVGTNVIRASYADFSDSAAVLTVEPPGTVHSQRDAVCGQRDAACAGCGGGPSISRASPERRPPGLHRLRLLC